MIVLLVILDRSLGMPRADRGGATTPISINAIATSLNLPFESVRRRVNALLAASLCLRTANGIIVPPDAYARHDVRSAMTTVHDLMIWLCCQLHAFGVALPPPAAAVNVEPLLIIGCAVDLLLAIIDHIIPSFESALHAHIFAAILCANTRHITFDPALARRYASVPQVMQDDARQAITLSAVARALALPYSTVRHYARDLLRDEILTRAPGGFMVPASYLAGDHNAEALATVERRLTQILQRLSNAGFNWGNSERYYLGEPPTLLKVENAGRAAASR